MALSPHHHGHHGDECPRAPEYQRALKRPEVRAWEAQPDGSRPRQHDRGELELPVPPHSIPSIGADARGAGLTRILLLTRSRTAL